MNNLVNLWFFFRPLIDVIGTFALLIMVLFGCWKALIWFVITFIKQILFSFVLIAFVVIGAIILTIIVPGWMSPFISVLFQL